MAKQKAGAVLNRLAGKKIVFNGKFEWGQRERLEPLAIAHGATILEDLDATVDYLVLPDPAAGKTIQAKAKKLNSKGATIRTLDADTFEKTYEPTDEETVALIRIGREGAEFFGIFSGLRRGFHSTAPPKRTISRERFDGLDLTGFRFGDVAFDACSFIGTTLSDAFFSTVRDCDFSHATGQTVHFESVTGSRFIKARLANVTIHGDIDGLNLAEAEMPGLVFWGRLYMGTHRHPSSKMSTGVMFRGGKFVGSKIQPDGGLSLPDFAGADLSRSMLSSCDMTSPNFRNAILRGAVLSETKLTGADFRGADLTDAELAGADLRGALFDGAMLKGCNLLDAKLDGVDLSKASEYSPSTAASGAIGPALNELDKVAANSRRIQIQFHVRRKSDPGEGEQIKLDTSGMKYGWGLMLPTDFHLQLGRATGSLTCSDGMMRLAKLLGHWQVRYETLEISSTKASLSGKPLRELVLKGIAEAFAQPVPDETELSAATKAYREKQKEGNSVQREEREKAKQEAEKQKEKAKKQIAKKIEKQVGKVTDTATFLKALELRIEPEKIKKATKMLKASRFQLYNDVTDTHTSGVVKSQTDADLVYACRINEDGSYSCCTQNLNVCGGLRGSICKHLLVLIIGLVNANQLDPVTIDQWVAKSQNVKPVLDKEKMGEIFIRYKGAEAGEVDWRPTETLPEDYYSL